MIRRTILLVLVAFGFCTGKASAGNPLVDGKGLADPHGLVYDGRVYLFATHDFSPANKKFVMKDWWVWSSADLVNWSLTSTLQPEDTFLHRPFNDCWATFGVRRNNKFYWYFSAGRNAIGVAVADTPAGPWRDPLGKPLIAEGQTPTQQRDPDILMDEDGQAYMIYGTFDYFIVRLNGDMISLAETPRPVAFDRRFGPYGEGKTDDKPSLHKHHGLYYLSWSSFYATSPNLYGPYTYKGSVIDPAQVSPDFAKQQLVRDRHGNFFEFNNQCYYTCNDQSQPGHTNYFRDAIMSYVHYRANGDIAPVRIDRIGVGQYDAGQGRIEAEDYFKAELAETKECPAGGFEMQGLQDGSYLVYPHVMNLPADPELSFRAAAGSAQAATVEIREADPAGEILGVCQITPTGGWQQYQTFHARLKFAAGSHNLCLLVRGGTGDLLHLDWFGCSRVTD